MTPTDDEMREEALRLAGEMAECAILLVGGEGINGRVPGCCLPYLSDFADQLRRSVERYNNHIIQWTENRLTEKEHETP